MDYALKSDVPSKGATGAALGTGIAGLSLGVINLMCEWLRGGKETRAREYAATQGFDWNLILPILMQYMSSNGSSRSTSGQESQYETKECAQLRQENSVLKAEQATDAKIFDLYKGTQNEFEKRDTVITAALIEEGKQQERINCLRKDVDKLQEITAVQNVELADIRVREAQTNGRINTFAAVSKEREEAFYKALGCETDARIAGDKAVMNYADCNFARNKKVIPTENLCEKVVAQSDVLAYYLAGNTSPTPNATNGTSKVVLAPCGDTDDR